MNALTDFSRAINVVGGTNSKFDANIQGTKLTLSVVEIVSDYGIIQVIPDLFLNRTSGLLLELWVRNQESLFLPMTMSA